MTETKEHINSSAKEHISARISSMCRQIVDAEIKARGLDGLTEFLEVAIISSGTSKASQDLIMRRLSGDQRTASMLAAVTGVANQPGWTKEAAKQVIEKLKAAK